MGVQHPDITEDTPYNLPETVELAPGEKATIVYQPEGTGTTFVLPELGISKQSQTTYELKLDDSQRYHGEIPPTDIDDSNQTFIPAWSFTREMQVIIRNFGDAIRTYHVQPKGWETTESVTDGGA